MLRPESLPNLDAQLSQSPQRENPQKQAKFPRCYHGLSPLDALAEKHSHLTKQLAAEEENYKQHLLGESDLAGIDENVQTESSITSPFLSSSARPTLEKRSYTYDQAGWEHKLSNVFASFDLEDDIYAPLQAHDSSTTIESDVESALTSYSENRFTSLEHFDSNDNGTVRSFPSDPDYSSGSSLLQNFSSTSFELPQTGDDPSHDEDSRRFSGETSSQHRNSSGASPRLQRPRSQQQRVTLLQVQSPFLKKSDKHRANLTKSLVSIQKAINILQTMQLPTSWPLPLSTDCLYSLIPLAHRFENVILRKLELDLQKLTLQLVEHVYAMVFGKELPKNPFAKSDEQNYRDLKEEHFIPERSISLVTDLPSNDSSNKQHVHMGVHFHLNNDFVRGFYHLKIAANDMDPFAALIYGIYLRQGIGCTKNSKQSLYWILQSAYIVLTKLRAVFRNPEEFNVSGSTFNYYRMLLAISIYEIGVVLFHGWSIPRDKNFSMYALLLSGLWGDVDAQYELALLLSLGATTDKDPSLAAQLFHLTNFQGVTTPSKCQWANKDKYRLRVINAVPAPGEVTIVRKILTSAIVNYDLLAKKKKPKIKGILSLKK
ncbi:SEL1 repeat protein Nif1 [Schizosaccharomyces japonicus yFS275]|uniref:SEL1 repeat protein Nif1 n=1 Tax=Schizosaccharomyces japonicus (strain yFS275 / FY16936) TaxID=402676 RepID=B6JZS9_SCHJY|nr:SEL1 repeat protein Nif1 [Schizosaccharomyces japonicus yFS275]EEB06079.1 SEL1 repeat protein Nif1 [Schizosaccharomyces japonicus yFS275]